MIHVDDMHFMEAKKKVKFKIKAKVQPFVYNTRSAGKEGDLLLKKMNFKLSFTSSYGPFGLISKVRVEQKTTPYSHTPLPKIKQYMNQTQWVENIL